MVKILTFQMITTRTYTMSQKFYKFWYLDCTTSFELYTTLKRVRNQNQS